MHFQEAYQHAVSDIKWLAGNPNTTEAHHDLAALRALIDTLVAKLPADKPDYDTEEES